MPKTEKTHNSRTALRLPYKLREEIDRIVSDLSGGFMCEKCGKEFSERLKT
jgi:hypothetical protein